MMTWTLFGPTWLRTLSIGLSPLCLHPPRTMTVSRPSSMISPLHLTARGRTRSSLPLSAVSARLGPPVRLHTNPSVHRPAPTRTRSRSPWLLTLALFPALYLFLPPSLRPASSSASPELDPQRYARFRVARVEGVSERHVLVEVEVPPASREAFRGLSSSGGAETGGKPGQGTIATLRHVCIKSPDLQIERPYTPINDVAADGVLRLVVKRVRGGEVGRCVRRSGLGGLSRQRLKSRRDRHIHSLKVGDPIEIRGPIRTAEIDLDAYDDVAMVRGRVSLCPTTVSRTASQISTGTGIAPFLQLLSILRTATTTPSPASSSTYATSLSPSSPLFRLPRFTLVQYLPHSPFHRARHAASASASTSGSQLLEPTPVEDPSGDHEDDAMDIALYPALVPRVLGDSGAAGASATAAAVGGPSVRFLRVQAGAQLNEADIAHAFKASDPSASACKEAGVSASATSSSRGLFGWLSSTAPAAPSKSSAGPSSPPACTVDRRAILLCLPLAQLPPVVGPPPRGPASAQGPLGGLLGRMGWARRDVYVL